MVDGGQLVERLWVLLHEPEEPRPPRRDRHGVEQRHPPEAAPFEEERAQGHGAAEVVRDDRGIGQSPVVEQRGEDAGLRRQ